LNSPCRIVVLISGLGSNLQAIIDACANKKINGQVVAVISNRPDVLGLERAARADIKAETLDHTKFPDRETFDRALKALIESFSPDAVLLAGFMRILTTEFTQHFSGKMLNIHPSRLPKFRGLKTHQRALEAGEKTHGASVHFVTNELDGGPVILQSQLKIKPEHTAETLAADVLKQEHVIYPQAVKWFCDGTLVLNNHHVLLNGKKLDNPIQLDDIESDF